LRTFIEHINEEASNQRTIEFDNINGQFRIFAKSYAEEGYDELTQAGKPRAEIKLTFEAKDSGIFYYYTEDAYDEDMAEMLEQIEKLADKFDKEIKDLLKKKNFVIN
jgi:hypothetical protein